MDEYINKQQLLEKAKGYQNSPFGFPLIIASIENAKGVKVIRCKDCKYLEIDKGLRQGRMCLIRGSDGWCHDNDFCSYGERKV